MFFGVAPFKMKSRVLVGSPWCLSWLIALMQLFISRKMSQQIVNADVKGV